MRKLRAKKKMLVPLKAQQKTTHTLINTIKVVSSTGKTTVKTLGSQMKKRRGRSFIEDRRQIVVVGFVGFVGFVRF